MQLHKSLLADALCAEDRAPATFLTYFFIFQNQTWCPRQHSPPIQTPLWQRVSTLVVLFKPLLWMFNSASNSWVPAKESILILQPFIVCAVSWTHGHACVLCSASDSGLLTSHPTRADTTMIQGNSYTFCFLFFIFECCWHTNRFLLGLTQLWNTAQFTSSQILYIRTISRPFSSSSVTWHQQFKTTCFVFLPLSGNNSRPWKYRLHHYYR